MLHPSLVIYLFAFIMRVLALPPPHTDLRLRGGDNICGTYRNDKSVGTIWLNSICTDMTFTPVEATTIKNSKCQMCILFTGKNCSKDIIYIGHADNEYHWWLEDGKQPHSYYCKDTFP